jgi:parallel beta-helix repeat protein
MNIKYDNTVKKKVKWTNPKRTIFRDMDGSLTGILKGGWVTPYYPHLEVKECKKDVEIWDTGILCENTVSLRRLAFHGIIPTSINSQDLKIQNIPTFNPIDPLLISNAERYSIIKWKELKNPSNSWTSAFVTGYNYFLTFGLGLNFNNLQIERSLFDETDRSINLAFNYSMRRDDFSVVNSIAYSETPDLNSFDNPEKFNYISDILAFGSYKNMISKSFLALRVNGKGSSNVRITAIQCKGGCQVEPPVQVAQESFTRRWSDVNNWPNSKLPVDNDVVIIKPEWLMILDVPTAKLKNITINGVLTFDNTKDNLILSSHIILIKDGRLEIGTEANPFTRKAEINLLGDKFTPNLYLDNSQQLSNKILANLNELSIFGEDRKPYKSKLLETASPGNNFIFVEKNLKWKTDDEIVIATTSYSNDENEVFKIVSYDSTTGRIVLPGNLKYRHFGNPTSPPIPDNPTDNLFNPDERGDVFMITRNIRIKGSEDWGCNVASVSTMSGLFRYNGKMNITHVEFQHCGQVDTEFPALLFSNTNSDITSNVKFNSFNLMKFTAVYFKTSSNINFEENILSNPRKYGIFTSNSKNINIINNIVSNLVNRPLTKQLAINDAIDVSACFYICQEGTICEKNILKGNLCAGSQFIGFQMDAYDCSTNLIDSNTGYNTAYTCAHGFLIMNQLKRNCIKGGNIISMRNYIDGYVSNPKVDESYHENIISIGDMNGVTILSGTSNIFTKKYGKRFLIMGQSLVNPLCIPDEHSLKKIQVGFYISVSSVGSMKIPLNKLSFPLQSPKSDGAISSFFEGRQFTFSNFIGINILII